MKSVMIAAALLVGTAAYAQDTTGTAQGTMAGGTTVAPSNAAPKRDARGVPVVSAEATAPAGYNQPPTTGPVPAAGPAPSMGSAGDLPPCTRKVTDHCTQTYERNHGSSGGGMAASGAASSGGMSSDTSASTDTSGTDTAATAGTGTGTGAATHHRRRHRR
jgi:hypothetical protein